MGLALHEMHKVSGLVMGDIPYEEYVSSAEKLHLMEDSAPLVYAAYWKVLCHFHICVEITGWRAGGIKQMAWEDYLFNSLGDKVDWLTRSALSTDAKIEEKVSISISLYTMESVDYTFRPGRFFESFHHQAKILISNRATSWISNVVDKVICCADTYPRSHKANVVYPTVLLAFGRGITLLSTMVGCIQSRLRALTKTFCKV